MRVVRFHFRAEQEVVDTFLEAEGEAGSRGSCSGSCHGVVGLPLLVYLPREPIYGDGLVSWKVVWRSTSCRGM